MGLAGLSGLAGRGPRVAGPRLPTPGPRPAAPVTATERAGVTTTGAGVESSRRRGGREGRGRHKGEPRLTRRTGGAGHRNRGHSGQLHTFYSVLFCSSSLICCIVIDMLRALLFQAQSNRDESDHTIASISRFILFPSITKSAQ